MILDRIRSIIRSDREKPEERALKGPTVEDVWKSPALFNRATRRRAGLTGRIWRWDMNVPGMQRTFVPRYIRRHFSAETMSGAKTRRQRKQRARIMRLVKSTGIAR